MRKIKSVIGQNVISLADGRPVGAVKDVVLSRDQERVTALVLDEGGLLSSARIIRLEAVDSYGRDAVVIEASDSVIDPGTAPELDGDPRRALAGMKVYSNAGEQVGTIADAYFEEDDGRIVGFEVSAGVMDDMAAGRRFLPRDDLDRVGDEIVYVRPEAASSLGPVPGGSGGASGVLDELSTKAGETAQEARDRASQMGASIGDAIGSAADAGTDSLGRPRDAAPGADLVGRRSGADVADEEGRIIVANGQIITAEQVARAEAADRSDALREAADAWTAADRERMVSGAIEQVTDAAGSAWDRFTRKIAELTDETGKRMSEQQTKARLAAINDAVGRPVTKVILDRSDEVILNLGDIITHEAVQRAYDAGTLDALLDSVYKGDVSFERDEMKAASQGTSTVEQASGGAAVVSELETSVQMADAERQAGAEESRRQAEEARDLREAERQEHARAREEAALRAEGRDPSGDEAGDEAATSGAGPGPSEVRSV
jgi:uncharacterized protein YrrD